LEEKLIPKSLESNERSLLESLKKDQAFLPKKWNKGISKEE